MTTKMFEYQLLTDADRSALRMDRAHYLEAELFRTELLGEEATDAAEREALANTAGQLLRRLQVHRAVLLPADTSPGSP